MTHPAAELFNQIHDGVKDRAGGQAREVAMELAKAILLSPVDAGRAEVMTEKELIQKVFNERLNRSVRESIMAEIKRQKSIGGSLNIPPDNLDMPSYKDGGQVPNTYKPVPSVLD